MLVCPKCNQLNSEQESTCSACGSSLAQAKFRTCPTCGTVNLVRDAFCIRCLTLLQPAESPIDTSDMPILAADFAADPLAELTHALPEAQLDFTTPPAAPLHQQAAPADHIASAEKPSEVRRNHRPKQAQPVVLNLIILVAALIPFILHGRLTAAVPTTPISGLLQSLAELPPDTPVLVAFDYGPAYAWELDPLAEIAIQALADRSARLLILSTHPLGIASAKRLFQTLELPAGYEYGTSYLFLGYLPGEEGAMRLLTTDFTSAFTLDYAFQQPLKNYPLANVPPQNISRVLIVSEDAVSVQHWVEQVQSTAHLPVDAVVTAAAEPYLVPYYLSHQLNSLTGGFPAVLEHQAVQQKGGLDLGFSLGIAVLVVVLAVNVMVYSTRYLRDGSDRKK